MHGICCVCQQKVNISTSSEPRQQEYDAGHDDNSIDMTYGDEINYVCDAHDFYGEHCDGSGQIPQFFAN
jgi:hypothetical protein